MNPKKNRIILLERNHCICVDLQTYLIVHGDALFFLWHSKMGSWPLADFWEKGGGARVADATLGGWFHGGQSRFSEAPSVILSLPTWRSCQSPIEDEDWGHLIVSSLRQGCVFLSWPITQFISDSEAVANLSYDQSFWERLLKEVEDEFMTCVLPPEPYSNTIF